jgi:hypothetical protein
MTHKDEFRARADQARLEAGESTLDNVRERMLRSAAAWDQMASREERVVAAREARQRDKAAEAEPGLDQA